MIKRTIVSVAVLALLSGAAEAQTGPASSRAATATAAAPRIPAGDAKMLRDFGETLLISMGEMSTSMEAIGVPAEKKDAVQKLMDDFKGQLTKLLVELGQEPLPENSRVAGVARDMQSLSPKINELLGKDWQAKLQDRVNSPLVQARIWTLNTRAKLPRVLALDAAAKAKVETALDEAIKSTGDLSASEAAKQADKLDAYFQKTRDAVLAALTDEQKAAARKGYPLLFRGEKAK